MARAHRKVVLVGASVDGRIVELAHAAARARRKGQRMHVEAIAEVRAVAGRARVGQLGARPPARLERVGEADRAPALAHELRVLDACQAARVDLTVSARRHVDRALEQIVRGPAAHEVAPTRQAERARAVFAAHLAHHRSARVLAEQQVARASRHLELAAAPVLEPGAREHEAALAPQVVEERRVLRARGAAAGGAQGAIVGVTVSLLEQYAAVAILVGRAEQSRHERVGEERSAQLIGLLRVFVGRAGREERKALARQARLVGQGKRLSNPPALAPGGRPRLAGVEHQNAKVGRRAAHQLRHLLDGQLTVAQMQRLGVGVARVVHEQHGLRVGLGHGRTHAVVDGDERAAHVVGARAAQHDHVHGGKAAELVQHVVHALRVGLGVAQGGLVRLSAVGAHDDGIALHPCRRGARAEPGREREGKRGRKP